MKNQVFVSVLPVAVILLKGDRQMRKLRIISLLLCVVLVAGLFTACGKKNGKEGNEVVSKVGNLAVGDIPDDKKENGNAGNVNGEAQGPVSGMQTDTEISGEYTGEMLYQAGFQAAGLPAGFATISLTAENSAAKGIVAADSSFIITTEEPVSEEDLVENLHLMAVGYGKELGYTVETTSDGYRLTPQGTMRADSLYRFVVGDVENPYASFVFQTESELVVKSVYPADRVVDVPVNTGVEIALSEAVATSMVEVIEDYITITPAADGEFRLYPDGKTIVFVPATGLAENTVYTIAVEQGLSGISGNVMAKPFVSQFRTGVDTSRNEKSIDLQLQNKDLAVTTGNTAELSFFCWYGRDMKLSFNDAKLNIYAYRSAADCIEAMKTYQSEKAEYLYTEEPYRYPTEGLTKISETTVVVKEPEMYSWDTQIELPLLDAGCYLVEVELSGDVSGKEFVKKEQAMLQVTDLLVYTENSRDGLLYWINDAKSGAVAGAEIQVTGFAYSDYWNISKESGSADGFFATERYTTDVDGVALQDTTNDDATAAFVLVKAGDKESYACVQIANPSEGNPYYSYLYTDREKYFTNDTVQYFGILAPKKAGEELPEEIYLQVSNALNPIPVKVDENGYFEGSVTLEDDIRWYLNLQFTDTEGNYIVSKGLAVTDEEKPVYVAEVSLDQVYYRRGDTVKAEIQLSFYDGTPATGICFDASFYGGNEQCSAMLVTDENGYTSLSWKPERIGSNYTSPERISFDAWLIGDDLSSLWVSENAYYFHTDKIFDVERVVPQDGGDSFTRVQLFERDYSKLNTKTDLQYPLFPQNSYGDRINGTVVVELYKNEFKKELIATEYDPVKKESYPIYNYYNVNECISKETKEVVNGELSLPHVKPEEDFEGYYTYKISYTDSETGCTYVQETSAVLGDWGYSDYEEVPYYDLALTAGPYDIGQQICSELTYGAEAVKDVPVLYTVYTESGMQYFLAKDGKYEFTFTQDMAPASEIYATICVQERIVPISDYRMEYDFENNNQLEVEIETEKQTYRPGETVDVTLRLKDGTVGTDAFAAFSVVDEACFDLQEQYVYLNDYLSWGYIFVGRNRRFSAFYGNYRLYDGSFDAVTKDEAAEMPEADAGMTNGMLGSAAGGMGAEVAIRKDFRDNPVFVTLPFDGAREVKYSFTVPDNITEWRITAIACDPCVDGGSASVTDVNLGYTVSDVVTSLPFFINAECNALFLAGDEIVVSARSYGTGVKAGDAVSYEAKLYDDNGDVVSTVGVDAFVGETTWLNFGKWDCGSYAVEVTATTAEGGDGVRRTLQVTESGTILPVQKDISVAELNTIEPSLYPVVLSIYDESYQPYVNAVNRLMCTYTNRNDSKVAYYIALASSEKLFGESGFYTQEIKEVRDEITASYGLLSRLQYGEGDLYFSALVCALAPELLTENRKAELVREFEAVLEAEQITDDVTLTTALFGLAALGRPVYADLNFVAETSGEFSPEAKWMLAAAYAYLGDFATAGEHYDSLTEGVKESTGNALCIKGNSTEETIKYSAYALLTASLVRKTDAEGLYQYLTTHESTLDLYQLEQATYLKYFYPTEAQPAKFSWTVGATTESVTLKPGEIHTLSLSKSDWDALVITEEEGKIRIHVAYLGSVEEALEGTEHSEKVKISKAISLFNQEKNIYAVTLNYTVTTDQNYSCFAISDYIPSGARWYPAGNGSSSWNQDGSWSQSAYVDTLTGQSVRGNIYVYHNNSNKLAGLEEVTLSGSVTYYIRGAVEGDFAVDYAVLRDRSTGGYAISESGTVNINDDEWKIALQK